MLVDDELIVLFYDAILPEEVVSGVTFEQWRRKAEKDNPRLLYLSKDELMRHEASGITTEYFPKTMEMKGVQMPLTYHFEPGSPRDGVTLAVPLYALNLVDEVRTQWLVPGMLKEKVQLLIKSLPQRYRRHCVPLADYAKGFALRAASVAGEKPLLQVLCDDIESQCSVRPKVEDFRLEQLPAHLTMNFKILDEYGRQIDMGRNLASLKSVLGQQAQKSFQEVASQDAEISQECDRPITEWNFGELPEIMEIKRKGQSLIGHPALVDHNDCCSIEVFDDPHEAARQHKKGLLRLFKLQLREQLRYLEKNLKALQSVQMQASMVEPLSKVFDSFETMREAVIDTALTQCAMIEPLPVNAEEFEVRRQDAKGKLNLIAQEISSLLAQIVALTAQVVKKQKLCSDKWVLEDINHQLSGLFFKDFLLKIGYSHLAHYPRYLNAILVRLEKRREDPEKDAQKMRDVNRFVTLYEREIANRKGVADSRLEEFRWMIEELRVSLFAQKLRTPMPVSVKRLDKVWSSMKY